MSEATQKRETVFPNMLESANILGRYKEKKMETNGDTDNS